MSAPSGPWLPPELPEAEAFNRLHQQWLDEYPEREARIAQLAKDNTARLLAELELAEVQ